MSCWALITGLVRDRAQLEEKVRILNLWRSEGIIDGILFSTWIDEIDKYDGLSSFLKKEGVSIVESTMPDVVTDGHMLHQMKSLALGLEACPDGAWVFRLRTDMITLGNNLKVAISKRDDLELAPLPGWPQIFKSRILIHGGLLFHPLFFNDILYMGLKEDLLKLSTGSLFNELFGLAMNPEQVFFSGPLLPNFSIFGHYFRTNPGIFHNSKEKSEQFRSSSLSNLFYIDVFMTNALVLSQYFRVGMYNRDQYPVSKLINCLGNDVTLESFLGFEKIPQRNFIDFFEPCQTLHYYSDYWVEALLQNRFAISPLGELFSSSLYKIMDFKTQEIYTSYRLALHPEAQVYSDTISSLLPKEDLKRYIPPNFGDDRITALGRKMNVRLG